MDLMKEFYSDIKKFSSNTEVEVRLGKINYGIFDTNIGEQNFEKIIKALKKFKDWDKVLETQDEVYYWANGIRCVYDGTKSVYEHKRPIVKKNMSMTPLDIRLGISQEIPCESVDDDAIRSVARRRMSFFRKNVRIDCTVVTGGSDDKDCEDDTRFQVELEFLDLSTDQLIFSALHKVKNVLEILKS